MKLLDKIYDFYFPEVEEEGLDIARSKCDEAMEKHDLTDPAFEKALSLRMKVDTFEADMAKNKPVKPKKEFKLNPQVVIATLACGAQVLCTVLVERYQADGGIFRSPTANWVNGNNLFTKLMNPFVKNS